MHFTVALATVSFSSLSMAQSTAGVYTLWSKGGVRTNALGGATVALDGDGATFVENAAAMVYQSGPLSGNFAYAQPEDKLHRPSGTIKQTEDYAIMEGSALLFRHVALGMGFQVLRFFSENTPAPDLNYKFKNSIADAHLGGAIKIGPLSFSGSYLIDSARHTLDSSQGETRKVESTLLNGNSQKYGLLMRFNAHINAGATYRKATILKADHTASEVKFFDLAYQPEIAQFGVLISTHPRKLKRAGFFPTGAQFLLQIDRIGFPNLPRDGKLYSAPGLAFKSTDKFELDTQEKWIPRIGIETAVARAKGFALVGRAGMYKEPAYLKNENYRLHTTFGAHLRLMIMSAQITMDVANQYVAKNYGFGLEFEN